jgi:hypothetical protein
MLGSPVAPLLRPNIPANPMAHKPARLALNDAAQ